MQRIVLIFLLFGFFQAIGAQERTDFSYYDSLTYKQYVDGSWKELSQSGNIALKMGYDYYYMRMRIGISYYERKSYLKALSHFKKALEFNMGDQLATEYIYYCYLFSGKHYIAGAYAQKFRQPLIEKTGINNLNKNRISVDFLYNQSYSEDIVNYYLGLNGFTEPGTLIIPLSYANSSISMHHDVNPGFYIRHSLSYLMRENSFFTNDGTSSYPDYEQKVKQIQYFISAVFSNTAGLSVTPSLYYLHTSYPIIGFTGSGVQNWAYLIPLNENNIGAGANLSLTKGLVDLKVNTYFSHLGSRKHFQAGAGMYLYPFANNSFYLGAAYNMKLSEMQGDYKREGVTKVMAGVSISNKFYLDITMLTGDIENFVEGGGQIVYNSINEINRIIKADISVPLGTSGFIVYLGSRYTGEYTAFLPPDYIYSTLSDKSFKSLSFIGGLSWTF